MTTLIEAAEIINKEFAGCYASVEGKKVTVIYRGKKSDKVFIENGEVTKIGGWQVAGVAGQIAERFNLIKKNKVKIINMEKIFERYELLCKDVKHQIGFVDDYYAFDFENLNETLKEMKKLQNKIKQNQIDEYEARTK